jgi:hypothetical protein
MLLIMIDSAQRGSVKVLLRGTWLVKTAGLATKVFLLDGDFGQRDEEDG